MSKKPIGFAPIARESNMTSMTNRMSRLAAAFGVAAILAGAAATPALADSNDGGPFFYEPGGNGSGWSSDRGYTGERTVERSARRARAQARGHARARSNRWFAHGAIDDPPGSAFQTFGNDQSMGKVR
jgi:hypothetical protein